jgi:hypothetical protein
VFGVDFTVCTAGSLPPVVTASKGMHVLVSGGLNEIDVHSNDLDAAGGQNQMCKGDGVLFDLSSGANGALKGIFRNNIIRSGQCTTTRNDFEEANAGADPRLFEHNDLDPYNTPSALYVDEGTTALNTAAAVDALTQTTANGTISKDPLYANYPTDLHLDAGSPCADAGTPTGAPLLDMDLQPRDQSPDIGADEL